MADTGHSIIQQTMDTYGHLFPDDAEHEFLAAAAIDLLSIVSATCGSIFAA